MKTHGSCSFSKAVTQVVCSCKFSEHLKIPYEYGCGRHTEGESYEEKLAKLGQTKHENPTEAITEKRKNKKPDISYYDNSF